MSGRLVALDAWRGILATVVVIYHFMNAFFATRFDGAVILSGAYVAVDAFFVISGFIISRIYFDKLSSFHDLKIFMFRRFFRLWPLNIVILLGFLACRVLAGILSGDDVFNDTAYSVMGVMASAVLLQSFGLFDLIVWNVPAWSISAEFYVYVLFGLSVTLFGKGGSVISALLSVVLLSFLVVIYRASDLQVDADYGVFRCIYGFSSGILVMWLLNYLDGRCDIYKFRILLQWLCVPGVVAYLHLGAYGGLSFVAPLIFSFFVIAFSDNRGFWTKVLSTKPFVFLANVSYSIYMTHWLILIVFTKALVHLNVFGFYFIRSGLSDRVVIGSDGVLAIVLLTLLIIVFFVSWVTYNVIELPFQRFGERFAPKRLVINSM